MYLKNTILNYYHEVELTYISGDIVEMVIEGYEDTIGDLTIANYEHLESIVFKDKSIQNVRSLVITNNPLLKTVFFGKYTCEHVAKLELSRLFYLN